MSFLKDVLRGIAIGVANIIPGVSGGTMMVSMGIYGDVISAVTEMPKQHFTVSGRNSSCCNHGYSRSQRFNVINVTWILYAGHKQNQRIFGSIAGS